jgi:hypothetical protein
MENQSPKECLVAGMVSADVNADLRLLAHFPFYIQHLPYGENDWRDMVVPGHAGN